MCVRPSLSGRENSTFRSRRPGRRRAGSRVSGLEGCQLGGVYDGDMDQDVPVSGHDDLDVTSRIETIQLVNQLQHGSLHLIVSTSTIIKSRTTNCVDFIKEDDTRLLRSGHLKQFSHHPGTFTNVLLHKFGTDDTYKGRVGSVGDGSSTKRFTGTGRTIEKDTLGGFNTEADKSLRLKSADERKFQRPETNNFPLTSNKGNSTTSRNFSICSLHPPTSA